MSEPYSAEKDAGYRTKPNPNQPDRCPSIDPHDELQCARRIHEDDQCQFGGIGWKKGTPRYISDAEKADRAAALAGEWETCGCRPVCWHRRAARPQEPASHRPEAPMPEVEKDAPFVDVPGGIDIARYFWHEIVMADQPVPYRRGQYHGCDGITLWREGRDYCYLWVEATVDHDMWMAYLLDIRTSVNGTETRDRLYLAAGAGDLFEVEWHNQPTKPLDDSIDHHYAAMQWFVSRDLGTIEERNGGAQGIVDRAVESGVLPPAGTNPKPHRCAACGWRPTEPKPRPVGWWDAGAA